MRFAEQPASFFSEYMKEQAEENDKIFFTIFLLEN